MRKHSRITSVLLAIAMLTSLTACGSQEESSSQPPAETTAATLKDEDKEIIESIEVDDSKKLDNGVLKWLSFWDINPAEGKAVPIELEMFKSKYGGKIEYIQTTWDDRFEKLATMVMSGDSPDMFPAGDLDVFPKCKISGLFDPLDDYVDFDSTLWADMNVVNDKFVTNDKHYAAATLTDAGVVCIYNKSTIEENNLDDPAELLAQGKWNWDTFYEMLVNFCDRSQNKFGIDGWWFEGALATTTGVPYIGMQDGLLTNNLDNSLIFKTQEFMEKLKKQDLPYPKSENSWQINPKNIGDGKTLFYPCGIWALYNSDLSNYGNIDDIMFVPMPKCTYTDEYFLPTSVSAYALCKQAPNPEAVGAFLKCAKIASTDESVQAIAKTQLFEDYGWTDEMYDMLQTVQDMTNEHPVIDFYGAVSATLYDLINNPMKESYNQGISWTVTKESIMFQVDAELEKANAALAG